MSRAKPIKSKIITILALLPIGLCMAAWFVFIFGSQVDLWVTARQLRAERQAATREGIPLDSKGLQRHPPVPASQNAADTYREASDLEHFGMQEERSDILMPLQEVYNGNQHPKHTQVEEAVRMAAKLVAYAKKAAQYQDCDFQFDYDAGPGLSFREYTTMKDMVSILSGEAALAARSGNGKEAAADLVTAATISRHCGEEPSIYSKTVQVSTEMAVFHSLDSILFLRPNGFDVDKDADRILSSIGPPGDLKSALYGDCVRMVQMARHLETGSTEMDRRFQASNPTAKEAYEVRVIQFRRETLRGIPSDPVRLFKRRFHIGQSFPIQWNKPSYRLIGFTQPMFSTLIEALVKQQARRELTRATADLVRFKVAHGAYPLKLDELKSAYKDPFNAKSLIYRPVRAGFVLYSVGSNLKDDGGIPETSATNAHDIVVQSDR